jgi:hypothetical protein
MATRCLLIGCLVASLIGGFVVVPANAGDPPTASHPMQRRVIDEITDVADWYNGSPDETSLSLAEDRVKQGRFSLRFSNLVDHTRGEKNYPVGWPRTGRDLASLGLTDWSDYEFFECWIYATTSREALPKTPLGIGFYHSGPKRSTSFPLNDVQKDAWTRIEIPVSRIDQPQDVQRVQFNISESNYRHGDRVDFWIDAIALTRYRHPVIDRLDLDRWLLFANDPRIIAKFSLLGVRSAESLSLDFEIGTGGAAKYRVHGRPDASREMSLTIPRSLEPGTWWARLRLYDGDGQLLDQRQVEFRVIEGPF